VNSLKPLKIARVAPDFNSPDASTRAESPDARAARRGGLPQYEEAKSSARSSGKTAPHPACPRLPFSKGYDKMP
jgi:hypothetical protein